MNCYEELERRMRSELDCLVALFDICRLLGKKPALPFLIASKMYCFRERGGMGR